MSISVNSILYIELFIVNAIFKNHAKKKKKKNLIAGFF